MTNLTKKDVPYEFEDSCKRAMQNLQQEISRNVILAYPEQSKKFYLETDASDFAIGAALHQMDEKTRSLRPIGFYSRKFTESEINYDVHDKELCAIVEALQHWRHYLVTPRRQSKSGRIIAILLTL